VEKKKKERKVNEEPFTERAKGGEKRPIARPKLMIWFWTGKHSEVTQAKRNEKKEKTAIS